MASFFRLIFEKLVFGAIIEMMPSNAVASKCTTPQGLGAEFFLVQLYPAMNILGGFQKWFVSKLKSGEAK